MDNDKEKETNPGRRFHLSTDANGGRVVRFKKRIDTEDSEYSNAYGRGRKTTFGARIDKEAGTSEHEIYVPPELKSGDEIIEARKKLRHQAGFNLDELFSAHVKVTGENPPRREENFRDFQLTGRILHNISKCGFKRPTPVQQYVIPMIENKRDVMACGQTGSGKTAAFLLPIIHRLSQSYHPQTEVCTPAKPRALILAPVRELALQIAKEAQMYLTMTNVTATAVYGGTSTEEELRRLKANYTIIVATPGRLQQLLREGNMTLENVEFVIIDEADKMLTGGFMEDIYNIYEHLPPSEKRVTAIFSATFPLAVQKLAKRFLVSSYLMVVVGSVGGASYDVDQSFEIVEATDKYHALTQILSTTMDKDKILVFCATRTGTQELVDRLAKEDLPVIGLHGEMFQSERERSLNQIIFKEKKILVASGIASRGLDIPQVTVVINYDLPTNIDEYVQQIGRTGRIGNKGRAISFFEINRDHSMASKLIATLRQAGQPVPEVLEQVADQEREMFNNGEEICTRYPTVDMRYQSIHYNALGVRPRNVPLPCEDYTNTWD